MLCKLLSSIWIINAPTPNLPKRNPFKQLSPWILWPFTIYTHSSFLFKVSISFRYYLRSNYNYARARNIMELLVCTDSKEHKGIQNSTNLQTSLGLWGSFKSTDKKQAADIQQLLTCVEGSHTGTQLQGKYWSKIRPLFTLKNSASWCWPKTPVDACIFIYISLPKLIVTEILIFYFDIWGIFTATPESSSTSLYFCGAFIYWAKRRIKVCNLLIL